MKLFEINEAIANIIDFETGEILDSEAYENLKMERKDKLTKQLKECRDYDEKISHLSLARIALDLDDGVKVNYRKLQTAADGKFYEVLADSKNIMAKEKK